MESSESIPVVVDIARAAARVHVLGLLERASGLRHAVRLANLARLRDPQLRHLSRGVTGGTAARRTAAFN
jgi:hypothetical protein